MLELKKTAIQAGNCRCVYKKLGIIDKKERYLESQGSSEWKMTKNEEKGLMTCEENFK